MWQSMNTLLKDLLIRTCRPMCGRSLHNGPHSVFQSSFSNLIHRPFSVLSSHLPLKMTHRTLTVSSETVLCQSLKCMDVRTIGDKSIVHHPSLPAAQWRRCVQFTNSFHDSSIGRNKQVSERINGTRGSREQEELATSERVHRFIAWLGGFYSKKAVLSRSSARFYESCVDSVKTEDFFTALDLPNTFQSWFLVTHLHLWMCLVRLKREGQDGDFMIKELVTTFWEDVRQRMTKLGVRSGRVASRNITEFHHAFNGMLVAYEEGLLYDDMILASAIWRNMYQDRSATDPVQLAKMVEYIRKQVHHMDNIDSQHILDSGIVTLLPFTES